MQRMGEVTRGHPAGQHSLRPIFRGTFVCPMSVRSVRRFSFGSQSMCHLTYDLSTACSNWCFDIAVPCGKRLQKRGEASNVSSPQAHQGVECAVRSKVVSLHVTGELPGCLHLQILLLISVSLRTCAMSSASTPPLKFLQQQLS